MNEQCRGSTAVRVVRVERRREYHDEVSRDKAAMNEVSQVRDADQDG